MQTPNGHNAAVLFLDLQEEIVKHSQTVPAAQLQRSAGVLARLAALHKLPTFVSAVPRGGATLGAVLGPLAGTQPRMRTQTTAFADAGLVAALAEAGRKVLVLAGVASEIVVQRTALDALAAGYEGAMTSVTTFAAELAGDFTTELGGATMGLMYETIGG